MIAAIYARKSTEQNGVSDDQKSVARQVERAREYATSKGWAVAEDHVYIDDGVSGAEFANRPGFLRLMNAVKPRAPFGVLVMSEESRLGREAIETAYALKQLVTAGARVFFYLENRERTLDSPTDKIMLSLTAYADELERERARQRTYDAMLRKARAGHVTGGRTFGYENVAVLGLDGRRSHVERRILEAEADVIRSIFTLCADGVGLTGIAHELNAKRAPCPRAQAGRPCGWSRSTIREILYREIYRGVVVWNRSQKRDQWGQKRQHRLSRRADQWIRVDQPDARIVSESLWVAAHDRLGAVRARALRLSNGKLLGRPPANGVKYLLAGMLTCGSCGSSLEARSRSHGRRSRRGVFYGCAGYARKGCHICANKLTIAMETADEAILSTVERILLNPDVVREATRQALEALSVDATIARRAAVETDLADVETELAHLSAAIASGGQLDTILTAIRAREAKRGELRTALEQLAPLPDIDPKIAAREVSDRVEDWRGLLRRQPAQGQQILRKLIDGRLTMTPLENGGGYRFSGRGSFVKLLGTLVPQKVASPTGPDTLCTREMLRIVKAA